MLSAEALKKFQEIWRAEKGVELSDSQATEVAIQLLTIFDAIYRPIKRDWLEENNNDSTTKTETL